MWWGPISSDDRESDQIKQEKEYNKKMISNLSLTQMNDERDSESEDSENESGKISNSPTQSVNSEEYNISASMTNNQRTEKIPKPSEAPSSSSSSPTTIPETISSLFIPVRITSIHSKRRSVSTVYAGQTAALLFEVIPSIDEEESNSVTTSAKSEVEGRKRKRNNTATSMQSFNQKSFIRRGQVLLKYNFQQLNDMSSAQTIPIPNSSLNITSSSVATTNSSAVSSTSSSSSSSSPTFMSSFISPPLAAYGFEAEITIINHPSSISVNYSPIIHVHHSSVIQAAKIVQILSTTNKRSDNLSLRVGDTARVLFHFLYTPEYITESSAIILREGQIRGFGTITKVLLLDESKIKQTSTLALLAANQSRKKSHSKVTKDRSRNDGSIDYLSSSFRCSPIMLPTSSLHMNNSLVKINRISSPMTSTTEEIDQLSQFTLPESDSLPQAQPSIERTLSDEEAKKKLPT